MALILLRRIPDESTRKHLFGVRQKFVAVLKDVRRFSGEYARNSLFREDGNSFCAATHCELLLTTPGKAAKAG